MRVLRVAMGSGQGEILCQLPPYAVMDDLELVKSVELSIYVKMWWLSRLNVDKLSIRERNYIDWDITDLDEIDVYNAFEVYWDEMAQELIVSGDDGQIYLEIVDLSKLPTLIQGEINND